MTINKQEIRYIGYSIGFAFVFFVLIMPYLLKNNFDNSNVYLQFGIFNLGLLIFLQIFLKHSIIGSGRSIMSSIGIVCLFIALDIFAPPYSLNLKGELLTGPVLSESSSDYVAGYFAHSLGINGFLSFGFVYIIVPAILLTISAFLLKNFVREL